MGKAVGWEGQRAVRQAAQGREGMHQGSSHWQGKMWLKKLLYPQPTPKGRPLIFLRKRFICFFLCLAFLLLKMSPFCCDRFSDPEKSGQRISDSLDWADHICDAAVFILCLHFHIFNRRLWCIWDTVIHIQRFCSFRWKHDHLFTLVLWEFY